MLQEAFKFLFDAGRDSAPEVVKAPGEPDHLYYLRKPGGELVRTEAAPYPAKHAANSLQAIIELAKREEAAQCWHSTAQVRLNFGDAGRDYIALQLSLSDQIKQLISWRDQKQAATQAELIRLLRTTFRDSLSQAGTLLESLRKVKFNLASQVSGEVGHGKASLGKEIMGEVTGTGLIPEYVTFNFPVFANPCLRLFRASVECAIDPDAASGNFRVIPLPGQIENAVESVCDAIGSALREALPKTVPLYYGTP